MRGIKREGKVRKTEKVIIAAIILIAFVGAVSAATLTVTPDTAVSGSFVTIEGAGFEANKEATISSTVTGFRIPVLEDGKYAHSLVGFNISDEHTSFSLSVREVENDMKINVKRFWWTPYWTIDHDMMGFVFSYDPVTHTATVTRGMPTPTGVYEVIDVMGNAVDGATTVTMTATVTRKVMTDASGGFKEVIDTHGIPAGTYTINATDGVVYAEAMPTLSLDADVSKDGYVGVYDCVCIARYVLSVPGYDTTTLNIDVADINGDGIVDLRDARCLARQLIGLPCPP